MMECHYCGMTDFDDDNFCNACGADFAEGSAYMEHILQGAGPAENSDTEDTEGADSDVDMEAMAAMRKTNLELHKAISEDMKQFLTANPGGTIQKWAASSEWTRDTGGERDATGAPVRVTTGIFLELFQSMVTEVAAAAPADEDGW